MNSTGPVLFLEEDHYVSEDFIYLLEIMQRKANELCGKCNILSLGTYLKTLNYYTYSNNHKVFSLVFFINFFQLIDKTMNRLKLHRGLVVNTIWDFRLIDQHGVK